MKKSTVQFFSVSFLSGTIFAIGLAVSGMIHPGRVRAFLDVTGDWNPSLAWVMVGAIFVYALAHRFVAKNRSKPFVGDDWSSLPTTGFDLPPRAAFGNVLFGVGWGLSGLCPAPGLMSVVNFQSSSLVFLVSMFLGFFIKEFL